MNNSRLPLLQLLIIGLLIAALATRNAGLVWMAVPFLAYLGVALWKTPVRERLHLQAERTITRVVSGVEDQIQVRVVVKNRGPALDAVRLIDPLLPGMRLAAGSLLQAAAVGPGEEVALEYSFTSERGFFTWDAVQVVTSDPFGLFPALLELPAAGEIQVQPQLQRIPSLPVYPFNTLHLPGAIPARRGGSGTDFWGVREYHPGDALRRLDWQRSARHPRHLFTREFQQEEIAAIGLVLDARAKTDLQAGKQGLFDASARAAAALAEMFLHQGNLVGLHIFKSELEHIFPGYGKIQLNRILSRLAQVRPDPESGAFRSLEHLPVDSFARSSLVVVISPLAPDDWRLFLFLRAHRYPALLISPDPIPLASRLLPDDPAARLALRAVQIERRLALRKIEALQVPVIDWQVDQPLAPLVRATLLHGAVGRAPFGAGRPERVR